MKKISFMLSSLFTIALLTGCSANAPQSQTPTPIAVVQTPTDPVVKTKSLDDYMNNYKKSPIKLSNIQIKQLVKVFSLGFDKCTSTLDSEICSPEMIKDGNYLVTVSLFSDSGWENSKDSKFYFEYGSEGGPIYFGPFNDNVLRLKQEASQKENIMK